MRGRENILIFAHACKLACKNLHHAKKFTRYTVFIWTRSCGQAIVAVLPPACLLSVEELISSESESEEEEEEGEEEAVGEESEEEGEDKGEWNEDMTEEGPDGEESEQSGDSDAMNEDD